MEDSYLLTDLQGSLTQRLCFFVLPSLAIENSQIVQSCRHLQRQKLLCETKQIPIGPNKGHKQQ